MSTKQVINQDREISTLPTGYAGANVPEDFNIPPSSVESVDFALFKAFDKEMRLEIEQKGSVDPVPVVFAGAERFASVKKIERNKPIRDRNGAIILPIISIRRTSITHDINEMNGRGLGQYTGDIVVKKRLSSKDPSYQSIVNKAKLSNQDNVASFSNLEKTTPPYKNAKPEAFASRRLGGTSQQQHSTGELLKDELGNNIFEIITVPFPEFFVANYEIVVWTQYIQHMNQLLERIFNSSLFQVNQLRIETDEGYWFVAYFDDNFNAEDNFKDYTENEKIIKYSFNMKVPAYLIAPRNPSDLNPFRKYLSSPQVCFGIFDGDPVFLEDNGGTISGDVDKFILSEVKELNKLGEPVRQEGIKTKFVKQSIRDPFTNEETEKFVQVVSRNRRSGETVANSQVINKIGTVT